MCRTVKKNTIFASVILIASIFFVLSGCVDQSVDKYQEAKNNPSSSIAKEVENQSLEKKIPDLHSEISETSIWIEPGLENHQRIYPFTNLNYSIVNKENATIRFESKLFENQDPILILEQYFVLTVPFINQTKDIGFEELQKIWALQDEPTETIIWIDPDDLNDLKIIFNQVPGKNVVSSIEQPEICKIDNCFRIMDFSEVDARWRIIKVDNQSLLMKDFLPEKYRLVLRIFAYQSNSISRSEDLDMLFEKESNFSPSLLTSVMLTGTTALVRNTAYQIEQNGVEFPLENINELVEPIDILHVSNEAPFYSQCPPAIPLRKEMRFCSAPNYIETLKLMGVDVVELTGNHLLDWGPEAFLENLELYKLNGIKTYGGGSTPEEAKQPLIIEHNGNKIAFIGCNLPGPTNNWVSKERPGSLLCDFDELENLIKDLRENQINPIFTFQHYEFDTFSVNKLLRDDFWKMANAGAVIVSGSQAHFPQGIDFVNSSFVHYGLGNFIFDQMYSFWRMATIDVHYFYDNRYINTYQIPIINENFGQPREMTEEEAKVFFDKIFNNSFYYQENTQ